MGRFSKKLIMVPFALITAFNVSACKDEKPPTPPEESVAGDPVKGKEIALVCTSCHSFEASAKANQGLGPPLYGVYGREIAGVEGYNYSDALKSLDGVWDETLLETFLKSPQSVAKGSKMVTSGLYKEKQIKDVVAYLKSLEEDTRSKTKPAQP